MFLPRTPVIALAAMLALTTACTNKKVSNPLAKVDSKQPDKVLFDRGMDALKHNRYDMARLEMQTLINTYPDSEFIARAKLALADSWYAEGGTAALAQAEQEYEDFRTFFPNMPEAAEAAVKIANIHYQQMEKPDRDFTHAVRAEEKYREVIQQYPDNPKMVAEARTKLLQVQEVIAEREFRIGRFYYLRQAFPAAIARLQSLQDRYPLYSGADETLFLLGQAYEGEIAALRKMDANEQQLWHKGKVKEAQLKADELARERMSTDFTAKAAAAYSKILTRYPVMLRSDDARARLIALHQPVPRPTKAALALNKAEEASRGEQTLLARTMGMIEKHPDVSAASKVGDPALTDPTPVSASDLVQQANRVAGGSKSGEHSATVQTTGKGEPGENEPAPRSDAPAAEKPAPAADTSAQAPADPNDLKPTAETVDPKAGDAKAGDPKAGDAKASDPNAAPDPNELQPTTPTTPQPAPAPAQINDLAGATSGNDPQAGTNGNNDATASSSQDLADDNAIASSKRKKKKGLSKIIPIPKSQ
jgi:outer membrane protein assembly factor BamD